MVGKHNLKGWTSIEQIEIYNLDHWMYSVFDCQKTLLSFHFFVFFFLGLTFIALGANRVHLKEMSLTLVSVW